MDALQNRTNAYDAASPAGRNGITLTTNANISNTVESIVNGVDDQPITVTAGTAAKIAIGSLATGTYAYVYATKVPENDERIYNIVDPTVTGFDHTKYYEVSLNGDGTDVVKAAGSKAAEGKVYFVKNYKSDNTTFDSYTFKQTKVNDDVEGLVEVNIPGSKATSYDANNFYFDVYNQNDGAYAVKVIKVVE